jgi:hypothetical protein
MLKAYYTTKVCRVPYYQKFNMLLFDIIDVISNYKNIAAAAPNPTKTGPAVFIGPAAPVDPAATLTPAAPLDSAPPEAVGVAPEEVALAPCVALNFSKPAVSTTWYMPRAPLLIVTVSRYALVNTWPLSVHQLGGERDDCGPWIIVRVKVSTPAE